MLVYIIKFSACLAIFMVFYKLVLEKENMHTFKRFYLLAAIGLAIGIPLVTFIEYIEPLNTLGNFQPPFMEEVFFTETEQLQSVSINYLPYVLWSIYGLGVLFFGIKFALNLNRIHHKIKHNPKQKIKMFTNVLLKNLISPHTFFNYIFLNKSKFESNEIPEEVFIHEQAHATQKHSIDVLIIELLQVIFWFNPLLYLVKKDIKLNHEFLADKAVLNNGISTSTYQEILLAFSASNKSPELVNAISYSSIKKRFTVMKTQTSKRSLWLRSLLLLPLLAILLYSFSEREQIVKDIEPLMFEQTIQKKTDEASEEMMLEYNSFIIEFITTHNINMSKYRRIVAIYDLMSSKQKASVEPYPVIPSFNLSKTKPIIPTKIQLESWKNAEEFAIWIDGKHVNNTVLNNYNSTDFAHYVGSKVHKNARSKKFPQPFQFSLYTKKGFENTYQNFKVNEYHSITKKYSEAIKNYLKTNQTDDSELRILKAQTDKVYQSFSKEEITKHNILPSPPVPDSKDNYIIQTYNETPVLRVEQNKFLWLNGKKTTLQEIKKDFNAIVKYTNSDLILKSDDTVDIEFILEIQKAIGENINTIKTDRGTAVVDESFILNQQKATPKQIAEYNRLSKHINSQPKDQPIIKLKDLERLKYLYSIMSDTQKKNAEPFPNIPPPPPPPPNPKQVIEVKNIPSPNAPQNNKNKSGPNSSSNYIQKPKDSVTFTFSSFSETQQKEEKVQSTMSEDQKKQLSYRKLILRASKLLEKKPTYKIKGQPVSIDDVYTFINDYPQSLVKTTQNSNKNLTLSFTNSNGKKMSYDELQAVYTKVFDMTNESELTIEVTPAPIPENATPEERARIIKTNQAYTKTKAGKIIKIAETPKDDEGIVKINGKTYYYKTKDGETTFYNKFGDAVDIKNINSFSLLKNTENQEKEWNKVKKILKEPDPNIEGKVWNSVRKSIKSVTENSIMINGKTPINKHINLTNEDTKNLELTLKNEKILSFSLKVPGIATQKIYGNTLKEKGKLILQMVLNIEYVQIFDIKTSDGKKHPPILITIED